MHVDKNVFENLFYTIMDVKAKTKDTSAVSKDGRRRSKRVPCSRQESKEDHMQMGGEIAFP